MAWHPLGWQPVAFAEIDKFPSAVLAHHYPHVPNWGDLTRFHEWLDTTVDLLVGGTPCQSFSVAGLRQGLADPRGNLALTYLAVADKYRPRWLVWENVPGVLSSGGGRDFGALLGGLAELGYGFAYRVLDAQYFGLAQRRARVFVVGHLGDWRRAAAVLFERESLSGSPPKDGQRAGAMDGRATGASCFSVTPLGGQGARLAVVETEIGSGISAVSLGRSTERGIRVHESAVHAPDCDMDFDCTCGAISGIRRLTPREVERLQGFPDDYTLIPDHGKPAADGPRYKALGNSMAVPVMAWIGRRIQLVEDVMAHLMIDGGGGQMSP